MAKSADAFRTISEVSEWLETPAHVLRFWESRFNQVKPVKRAGGRRYYRPADMLLLGGIRRLLHDDGITIKGVQKILREKGVKYVGTLSHELPASADNADMDADTAIAPDPLVELREITPIDQIVMGDNAAVSADHTTPPVPDTTPATAAAAAAYLPDRATTERITALYVCLRQLRERIHCDMAQE